MENKNQKNKIKRVINPVNSLTLEPGGVILVIEYVNGEIERRDRVKFPNAYKNKVLANTENPVSRIYLEKQLFPYRPEEKWSGETSHEINDLSGFLF